MNKKQRNALITLLVGAIIWFAPVPEGVTVVAWHLAAVFIATVVGFILQPLPIGAVAFIAITFSTLSGLLKVGDALSGYGNSTIWLIVCAFLYSRGFIKSGLGKRIAFGIIKAIGKSALSLGYAIAFSELIISPATPSATARGGASCTRLSAPSPVHSARSRTRRPRRSAPTSCRSAITAMLSPARCS